MEPTKKTVAHTDTIENRIQFELQQTRLEQLSLEPYTI
jgi:hypothetical protein